MPEKIMVGVLVAAAIGACILLLSRRMKGKTCGCGAESCKLHDICEQSDRTNNKTGRNEADGQDE
jgi:hypothetical protein